MQKCLPLLCLALWGLIGSTHTIQAQVLTTEVDSLPTLRPVLRINLTGPGLGLEAPANPRISVYVEAGVFLDRLVFVDLQGNPDSKIIGIPYATLQFRYYYNIGRRKRLGKQISYQSGNFLGIAAPYISATNNSNILTGIGPVWGHQRQLGKAGFTGFAVGMGFYLPNTDSGNGPRVEVNLNTWLGVGFAF